MIIIKLEDYYMEWSTVSDSPRTYGMGFEEFKRYYLKQYGEEGYKDFGARIWRVKKHGSSFVNSVSAEDVIAGNRAGPNGEELTVEETIDAYCYRRPVRGWIPFEDSWDATWNRYLNKLFDTMVVFADDQDIDIRVTEINYFIEALRSKVEEGALLEFEPESIGTGGFRLRHNHYWRGELIYTLSFWFDAPRYWVDVASVSEDSLPSYNLNLTATLNFPADDWTDHVLSIVYQYVTHVLMQEDERYYEDVEASIEKVGG